MIIRLGILFAMFATSVGAQEAATILSPLDQAQGRLITIPSDGFQGRLVTLPNDGSQGQLITSPIDGTSVELSDVPVNRIAAKAADGVMLKGLDKVSGEVADLDMKVGETANIGRIEVNVGACRFPEDNPTGEGYAWLTIRDPGRDAVLFEGWMVASSPALNALDHPRYDVWLIRCTTA